MAGAVAQRVYKALHDLATGEAVYDAQQVANDPLLAKAKPHHRKAVQLALIDTYRKRNEVLVPLPSSWASVLQDPRDIQELGVLVNVAAWLFISLGIQLCQPAGSTRAHLLGLFHIVVTFAVFGQRFILCLHYSSHRNLFSSKLGEVGNFLNHATQLVLAPFWGIPSGMYYVHHVVMHHQENNLFPYDISSTMPYQRDNFFHFLMYWANYWQHSMIYLPIYALAKKRFKLAALTLAGFSSEIALCVYSYKLHSTVAAYAVIVPLLVASFALMYGNWSQHVFVDPKDSRSNYALTYNLLNSPINPITFNDGYHIVHHLNPRKHWSEMPTYFIEMIDKHEQGGALCFDGLGFEDVGFYCMTGQLKKLAKHTVQLTEEPLSEEELVALFKRRLQYMPCERINYFGLLKEFMFQ